MDLKTHPTTDGTKGNATNPTADHHRFSPGPDLGMLQKSYAHHRDHPGVSEEILAFSGSGGGGGGYELPTANAMESCNNETGAPANRINPFSPFVPTPPGSGTNSSGGATSHTNNGSPFTAAVAAGLTQQSQLSNNQGSGGPPSFMDTTPPSSFCATPYNYSLYSMHSQDSRVKLEKEKESIYNNKQGAVEDKELGAAKWIS